MKRTATTTATASTTLPPTTTAMTAPTTTAAAVTAEWHEALRPRPVHVRYSAQRTPVTAPCTYTTAVY